MNWNASVSKHYRGPIDRVFVSLREVYEVDYFIDQYLRTRGYALNDDNRRMVGEKLEEFLGRVPYLRDDLNAFLDSGGPRASAPRLSGENRPQARSH